MNIDLRKIKIVNSMSEETICFQAEIWVDGFKTAAVSNSGKGEANRIYPFEGCRERLEAAERFALTLPPLKKEGISILMDLDAYIDSLLDQYLKDKSAEEFSKRLQKDMATKICWGKVGSGKYMSAGYGGKTPLTRLPKDLLRKLYEHAKSKLKDGEEIFNKNIPL